MSAFESDNPVLSSIEPVPYTGFRSLRKTLEKQRARFSQELATNSPPLSQFIQFCGVSEAEFQKLSDDERYLKSYRLNYYRHSESLIVRIAIIQVFNIWSLIYVTYQSDRLLERNERPLCLGISAENFGPMEKQPDAAFVRRTPPGYFRRTVIFEVGIMDPTAWLERSARTWIEAPGSPDRIVLMIDVNKPALKINFHVFKRDPSRQPSIVDDRQVHYAFNEQTLVVDCANDFRISGVRYDPHTRATEEINSLLLDFHYLMGRNPVPPTERDVVFESSTLKEVAEDWYQEKERFT
ncbi:hypothetical protein N7466_002531 [Penicillium verhagenii]|uniref:uncharacterized protein n=1 Tax=Penicillium verhagenii TaxID=1562060 RepID=UPI0025454800|nr:uncharacterized protein N7466_002531 [Penicillium verhagenii]KAJ5939397.1 hypothetical protein N7466_002531 [Penicillium verhagenii]